MADNSNAELVVAFSTAGSPEEASRIATTLVAEQLVACVNVVDNIHSIYRWQGAIESAAESLMLIKTRANLLPAIELRLHHCGNLAGFDAEHREAKNLIAVFDDQCLHKSASF